MEKEKIERIKASLRSIPDFPVKGILFWDVTTLFKDAEALHLVCDELKNEYKDLGVTKVVGIEARGFVCGAILAHELNAGFVPVRKPGNLPADTIKKTYQKEYGTDEIEIHRDAINENDVVVLHDDLLATGGTMIAAYELIKSMNPKRIYISFIVELGELDGRKNFPEDADVRALVVC